jgi:hypothetical protein
VAEGKAQFPGLSSPRFFVNLLGFELVEDSPSLTYAPSR